MQETIQHQLSQAFYQAEATQQQLEELKTAVAQGQRSPIQAAEELVNNWLAHKS